MLNLQNLKEAKEKLENCDVSIFRDSGCSFPKFIHTLEVEKFRHIENLKIDFTHPVTVLTGTNKIGKTSILLLIACSHEKFLKLDSTKPETTLKPHAWGDVLRFTKHEFDKKDYIYRMRWRRGPQFRNGEGKRKAGKKISWTGLAKKSSDNRENSKIDDLEVRLIDLERVLPLRNFSNSLMLKSNAMATQQRLNTDVEKAFAYIFDQESVEIYEAGSHVNKRCYLIKGGSSSYSSYGAASGEEAVISILRDIVDAEKESLILIDEMEAGFHPYVQRRLADVIQYISWHHKKQFIITTHSPTLMSAFPKKSRRFLEKSNSGYKAIPGISKAAAFSKMDDKGHPLVHLYCEDDLAQFIISQTIVEIEKDYQAFSGLINIIPSGPINMVKQDYERHKKNFEHMKHKIGYCCVFDGDHKSHPDYSNYHDNDGEFSFFLFPYDAPEKFLVDAYLKKHSHARLQSQRMHTDHHCLFELMEQLGLATDSMDARSKCFAAFEGTPEHKKLTKDLRMFLIKTVKHFSEQGD